MVSKQEFKDRKRDLKLVKLANKIDLGRAKGLQKIEHQKAKIRWKGVKVDRGDALIAGETAANLLNKGQDNYFKTIRTGMSELGESVRDPNTGKNVSAVADAAVAYETGGASKMLPKQKMLKTI